MEILNLVLAFCTGMAGAALGGCQVFTMVGLLGLAGIGLSAAIPSLGLGALIGNMAFGFYFHPAIGFFGYVCALAYAYKKGLVENGKDIARPLYGLNRPDVLLIGGASGLIGYIWMTLLTGEQFLGLKVDGGALTICTLSILMKAIFEKNPIGTVPSEVKARGGRFGVYNGSSWLPAMRTGGQKFAMSFAWAPLSATATYVLYQNEATAAVAPFVGFFICAIIFLWCSVGQTAPVVHHPSITASYAVQLIITYASDKSLPNCLLWAVAFGVTSVYIADFFADLFYVYGGVHVDPPAFAIAILSFCEMTVIPGLGLASCTAIPIAMLVICAVVAVYTSTVSKKKYSGKKLAEIS